MRDNEFPALGFVWQGKRGAGVYVVDAERLRTPRADCFSILRETGAGDV